MNKVPAIGWLSNRTKSRWGRRRPYLIFGAIPLGLATWLLFSIPSGLEGVKAFLIVFLTFLFFDTLHTLVNVPYAAMTPELTPDYDERTSLTAVREIFTVVGYIFGAAATTAVASMFRDGLGFSDKASYSAMGAVFGAFAAITILITAFGVRETKSDEIEPSQAPPIKSLLLTFRNRPFVRLMAAFFISSFSFTLLTGLVPFWLTYQLGMEDQIPLVMIVMLVTVALFLFPWKWVSDRINKGPAYAAGLFIASVAIIATFFIPEGPTPIVYLIAFVVGVGFSGQYVFPWSMLPDVVEIDEVKTGERREGIYYGVWFFVTKFTSAFALFVSGWALELFGYVPNVAQTDLALLGIRLFFGPIPAIALLISLPLLIWYPITKQSHAKLLAELKEENGPA